MGRVSCSIKRSVWFHLFVVYTIVCVCSHKQALRGQENILNPAEGGDLKNEICTKTATVFCDRCAFVFDWASIMHSLRAFMCVRATLTFRPCPSRTTPL